MQTITTNYLSRIYKIQKLIMKSKKLEIEVILILQVSHVIIKELQIISFTQNSNKINLYIQTKTVKLIEVAQ